MAGQAQLGRRRDLKGDSKMNCWRHSTRPTCSCAAFIAGWRFAQCAGCRCTACGLVLSAAGRTLLYSMCAAVSSLCSGALQVTTPLHLIA